jgi:hypothetical protein
MLFSNHFIKAISWFIIIASGTLLLYFVAKYASNVPYYDDFLWGFQFINQISDQNLGFTKKVSILFSRHNEHRIVWSHLVFWLNYALTGQLHFQWLIWVGNVALFALPVLFWKALPSQKNVPKVAWLAILALLLWQPQAYHNIFTTYGLANHYALLFTLASVYTLVFLPSFFVLSLILAVLASLCTGGGLVAWPLGISILLWQGKPKLMLGWLAAMIYFLAFHLLIDAPPPASTVNVPASLWLKAANVVLYVPTYCFALFEFGQYGGGITKMVATTVGFLFAGGVLFQTLKQPNLASQVRLIWKNRRTVEPGHLFLWHVVGFVLLTAFLASLKRTNPHLYDFGIPDHYRTNSQVFVGTVGLLLAHRFGHLGKWQLALVAVMSFWTVSYYLTMPRLVNLSRQLRADAHNFATVGSWALFPSHVGGAYYHSANRYTNIMIGKKIFVPQKLAPTLLKNATTPAPSRVYFDSISQSIALVYASNSDFVLYPVNRSQLLVLPLLHTFNLPKYWFKTPTFTRSTRQVKVNRWFWAAQGLPLNGNPTRVVNAVE